MLYTGVMHFVKPETLVKIVPDWLPAPRALVAVSGFFEIVGGVGLQIPRLRKPAAWGLIALYLAVFPANVNMAVHKIYTDNAWILWGRLPLQAVLIAWAWWYTRPEAKRSE